MPGKHLCCGNTELARLPSTHEGVCNLQHLVLPSPSLDRGISERRTVAVLEIRLGQGPFLSESRFDTQFRGRASGGQNKPSTDLGPGGINHLQAGRGEIRTLQDHCFDTGVGEVPSHLAGLFAGQVQTGRAGSTWRWTDQATVNVNRALLTNNPANLIGRLRGDRIGIDVRTLELAD